MPTPITAEFCEDTFEASKYCMIGSRNWCCVCVCVFSLMHVDVCFKILACRHQHLQELPVTWMKDSPCLPCLMNVESYCHQRQIYWLHCDYMEGNGSEWCRVPCSPLCGCPQGQEEQEWVLGPSAIGSSLFLAVSIYCSWSVPSKAAVRDAWPDT